MESALAVQMTIAGEIQAGDIAGVMKLRRRRRCARERGPSARGGTAGEAIRWPTPAPSQARKVPFAGAQPSSEHRPRGRSAPPTPETSAHPPRRPPLCSPRAQPASAAFGVLLTSRACPSRPSQRPPKTRPAKLRQAPRWLPCSPPSARLTGTPEPSQERAAVVRPAIGPILRINRARSYAARHTTLVRCRNSPGVWSLSARRGRASIQCAFGAPAVCLNRPAAVSCSGGQSRRCIVGKYRLYRVPTGSFRRAHPARPGPHNFEFCATVLWHHARARSPAPAKSARSHEDAVARCFTSCLAPLACRPHCLGLVASSPGRMTHQSPRQPSQGIPSACTSEALSYPASLPKPCLLRCSSMALRDLRSARMSTVPQRQRRERSAPVVSGRSWLPP